jgi:hypothetical protein
MASIKFRTDRKQGPTVGTILISVWLLLALLNPHIRLNDPKVLCLYLFFALIIVDLYWGTYILVDDEGVYAVDFFLYKNGIKFDELSGIYYHPTWIIGSSARTLSIVGFPRGKRKAVRLGTNHFYSQQALARIIFEVKSRCPRVEMDRPAELLMERYTKTDD